MVTLSAHLDESEQSYHGLTTVERDKNLSAANRGFGAGLTTVGGADYRGDAFSPKGLVLVGSTGCEAYYGRR